MVKGIILAGGKGTRLFPITIATSKQLLPVYNKPMIYLPLYLLIKVGVKNILIIVNKKDLLLFKKLLGNGKKFGVKMILLLIYWGMGRGFSSAYLFSIFLLS